MAGVEIWWFDRRVSRSTPLHVRHALLLAALAACGPADGDEGTDTNTSSSASDGVSSAPTDASASTFPPDPTLTTATTVTPTTEPPDPTMTTVQPTVPTTVSTVTTEVTFTDPSFTDSSFTDPSFTDPSFTDSSLTDDTIFIIEPDSASTECDIFAEDCPPGQKCMPFADNAATWNNLMCVPVMPNARKPGETCFVEGSGVSGIDNCEMHALCFNVDDDLEGTCVAMCTGSQSAPVCPPDSVCTIFNGGVVVLCLPTCDPLDVLSCQPGDVCVFDGDGFLCVFDGSDDSGQQFDECQFANGCDPGMFCADVTIVPGCDPQGQGCCTTFCDLTQPNLCPPGLACVPFFEQSQAPPEFADVGVCVAL